jgi:hypothetical protein
LTKRFDGNVCEKGIINVTARETDPERYGPQINGGGPRAVVDLDTQRGWYDKNNDPSWLQFDFKARRIRISSYAIKFGYESLTKRGIQKWRLEGSHNGSSWVTIDDRSKEKTIHSDYSVEHYNCGTGSRDIFRYVRIMKVDKYWGKLYQLGLTSIEFFGTLTEDGV